MAKQKTTSLKLNALLNTLTQLSTIILPFITFPYVTRVLGRDAYGKVSFANSIISYVAIFAALGIATYAIREGAAMRDDKKKVSAFSSELFSFNLVSTGLAYIGLFILLLLWKDKADYRLLIAIQSITVLMNTVGVSWIYTVFEDYLFVAVRSISIQLLSILAVFLFIKTENDYVIYAIIGVAGGVFNNLLNFIYARKYVKLKLVPLTHFRSFIKPILILFTTSALITVYLNADITMLGIMKNDTAVGEYEVAVKVYTIVKSILNAVVTVTIPRFSYYLGSGDYENYNAVAKQTFETVLLLSLPALTGLIMVSENVVIIMAGGEYVNAVLALRILSGALIFAVLANFFVNSVLLTHKRDNLILIATVSSAVLNVGLNLFFIPKWGIFGAAVTTLLAELLITVISAIGSRDVFSFKGTGKTFIAVLMGCLVIAAVCMALSLLGLNLLWDTVFKVLASVLSYAAVILLLKPDFVKGLIKSKE